MLGDERGEGEALFWIGCFRQVVQRNMKDAYPFLQRAKELAELAGERRRWPRPSGTWASWRITPGSCTWRGPGWRNLLQLRQEIGLRLGVAANQVGLAYVTAQQGDHATAMALLDEAAATARADGAHALTRQVNEARASLSGRADPDQAGASPPAGARPRFSPRQLWPAQLGRLSSGPPSSGGSARDRPAPAAQIQPASRAIRMASIRLRPPTLLIALDR